MAASPAAVTTTIGWVRTPRNGRAGTDAVASQPRERSTFRPTTPSATEAIVSSPAARREGTAPSPSTSESLSHDRSGVKCTTRYPTPRPKPAANAAVGASR